MIIQQKPNGKPYFLYFPELLLYPQDYTESSFLFCPHTIKRVILYLLPASCYIGSLVCIITSAIYCKFTKSSVFASGTLLRSLQPHQCWRSCSLIFNWSSSRVPELKYNQGYVQGYSLL